MGNKQRDTGHRRSRWATAGLLLAVLGFGLTACMGFFGQAPIALLVTDLGGDGEAPVVVTFDLSGSNDPDGTITAYTLDFGDGSTVHEGTDVSVDVTHEYAAEGAFTAVLTVTDNDGRVGMVNAVVNIGAVMISFATNRGADYDIYRMKADGSQEAAVYSQANDDLFADLVRGTRDKIAFASADLASWDIGWIPASGGAYNELVATATSNQIQPSWSADGAKIAFASNETQTPSATTWEIWTVSSSGGTPTQVTTQSPSWALAPAYSPVNDDIVFVSNETASGGSALWLWDDSANTASELYDSTGHDGDASPALTGLTTSLDLPAGIGFSTPAWSPDGAKIAFSSDVGGGDIDIYVMDADGDPTSVESLEEYVEGRTGDTFSNTITSAADEFCPYWLEDDSGMVFAKTDGSGDYQIYVVSFETGAVTALTATAGSDNVGPASEK